MPIPYVEIVDKQGTVKDTALVPSVVRAFAEHVEKVGGDSRSSEWTSPGELWETFDCESVLRQCTSKEAQSVVEQLKRGLQLRNGTDILDVWFDSGSSWAAVLGGCSQPGTSQEYSPTKGCDSKPVQSDMCIEGSDQHRGWFQSSVLTSVACHGEAPYRRLFTHGFVVDETGRKMSKSIGNVVTPKDLVQGGGSKLARSLTSGRGVGVDVLRWWVAASDVGHDIKLSKLTLSKAADNLRKVRGSLRFLLSNVHDFCHDSSSPIASWHDMRATDLHAVQHVMGVLDDVGHMVHVERTFPAAVQKIMHLCAKTLSSGYFESVKDVLYCHGEDDSARRSIQVAMFTILKGLCVHIGPFAPHLVEDVYQNWPEQGRHLVDVDQAKRRLSKGEGGFSSFFASGTRSDNYHRLCLTSDGWSRSALAAAHDEKCLDGDGTNVVSALLGLRRSLGPALELLRVEDNEVTSVRMVAIDVDREGRAMHLLRALPRDQVERLLLAGTADSVPVTQPGDSLLDELVADVKDGTISAKDAFLNRIVRVSCQAVDKRGNDTMVDVDVVLGVQHARCERCWEFSKVLSDPARGLCTRCHAVVGNGIHAR